MASKTALLLALLLPGAAVALERVDPPEPSKQEKTEALKKVEERFEALKKAYQFDVTSPIIRNCIAYGHYDPYYGTTWRCRQ
jgi:hypothetical protein